MKPLEFTRRAHVLRLALRLAPFALAACLPSTAPSPFVTDAGSDASGGAGGGDPTGGSSSGGGPIDDTLGGPCNDDSQCDDEIACTIDTCDSNLARCRHSPDDAGCQNGVFCDGIERCDPKLGCRIGSPVTCSDGDVCTIDACVEATGACTQTLRDADLDGSPDGHCIADGDCDDDDPAVSPLLPEVCQNQRDDDCDGKIDEADDCAAPKNDTCAEPLVIDAPGGYIVDTTAAALDFAASCGVNNAAGARDVVASLVLPAGPPLDVEISAKTTADVAIALFGQCGDPSTEIACSGSYVSNDSGRIAKIRARNIGDPAQSVSFPLYVFTDAGAPVVLDVAFFPATPAPMNETCGTAENISFGVPFIADVVDVDTDVGSACAPLMGDLVYSFDLAAPANVHIYADSIDGDGSPVVSLRDAACSLPENEITCQTAQSVHIFRHALSAGTYHVAVAATAPTLVSTTVVTEPATTPLADETCEGAPVLDPNRTIDVSFSERQDDIELDCVTGAADAAYRIDLPVASDVLLVQRLSQGDTCGVSLAKPACASAEDKLMCGVSSQSPLRVNKRNVPAGEYRVVTESILGQPAKLTAFVRKTSPAVLVPFADACADALAVPASGGFFQGNTANAWPSFKAGCDQAGGPEFGAKDQLLRLELATKKRVVLDMAGSSYTTLLDVRKGPDCPGTEVLQGCAVGYGQNKSFLDLTLDAGTYFIQIDGLGQDDGPWFLDVRVVDPP